MMKAHYRLLMAAWLLVMAALAGCHKDDDEDPTPDPEPKPEQQDTIPAPHDPSQLVAKLDGQSVFHWASGDSVRAFSLASVLQNTYTFTEGANADSVTLKLTEGALDFEDVKDIYAITYSKYIYGISATDEGFPRLTTEIPASYALSEVAGNETHVPLVVPHWGKVAFGMDGKLHTTLHPLTSMLSISTAKLPAGTLAIVLCTHDEAMLNGKALTGKGEALSGGFTSLLKDGVVLANDDRLVQRDTIRINMVNQKTDSAYDHIYIPLVYGRYSDIHIIAVTADDRKPYTWGGEEINPV